MTRSTCAATVSNYYVTVREQIYEFSTNFILSALTRGASTSTSAKDLYKELLTVVGLPDTPERERSFNKAFAEINQYSVAYCTVTTDDELAKINVILLGTQLQRELEDGADISVIRKLYGQILCLQAKLMDATETIKAFLGHAITPENQAKIFCLEGAPLSLAFVVDDTGSMANEIAAVQSIINLFVSSTDVAISDYILTTFNDPSMSYCD